MDLISEALRMDPLDHGMVYMNAIARMYQSDAGRAGELADTLLDADRQAYATHYVIAMIHAWTNRYDKAAIHAARARQIAGDDYPPLLALEFFLAVIRDADDVAAIGAVLERRGDELWAIYPLVEDSYLLIPTSATVFEFFTFYRTFEMSDDVREIIEFSGDRELARYRRE